MLGYDALSRIPLGQARSGPAIITIVLVFNNQISSSVSRQRGHAWQITNRMVATALKGSPAHISTATGLRVTLGRRLGYIVNVVSASTLNLVKAVGKPIFLLAKYRLFFVRAIPRLTVLKQAVVIKVRAGVGAPINLAYQHVLTIRRGLVKTIKLTSRIATTIDKTIGHIVTLIHQSIAVTALASRQIKHLTQLVTNAVGMVVSVQTYRGLVVLISSSHVITQTRNLGKIIGVKSSHIASIFLNPLVRVLDASLYAFGLFRHREIDGVPNLSTTNVLQPAIEPVTEYENVMFDYGLTLPTGVKILSAVLTCTVYSGTDATPSTRLIGYPVVTVSKRTGADSQAIVQQIGNTVNGVVYRVQCAATCSDGQVKTLVALLPSQASP